MRIIRACREMDIAPVAVYLRGRRGRAPRPAGRRGLPASAPRPRASRYLRHRPRARPPRARRAPTPSIPATASWPRTPPSRGPARRRGSSSSARAARPSRSWARRPRPAGWPSRPACPWCRGRWSAVADAPTPAPRGGAHRLPGDAQGGGGRRRQGHAAGDDGGRAGRGRASARGARPAPPSATTASTSRRPSCGRATSRSRSWPTRTATPCTCSSASARSSAATRR